MNIDIFNTPIEFLKGVGPNRAKLLKDQLKIFTYKDLLYTFPYGYVDRTKLGGRYCFKYKSWTK